MPAMARPWRAFAIVLALLLAFEVYAFFLKESGEVENIASRSDRHLTGEVAGEIALQQEIVLHADGFDGVDVWAHATSDTPVGPVRFSITQNTGAAVITVVTAIHPAADVLAAQPFHVSIPRIDVSSGTTYVLHIAAPQATRGHGLRFEASGPTYPEGTMRLGEREEWGDLQFRATAERTTIYRNIRHLRQAPQLPAFARTDLFFALMLLLFNLALATLLYALAFAPRAPARDQISSAKRRS
jgi:hypothetical protein